ncbi:hypothetical protein TNCV_426671 [Trichonephila clavipes]|nr:hypothetical protein TNCV_426671 [Trichonephila clavipes]
MSNAKDMEEKDEPAESISKANTQRKAMLSVRSLKGTGLELVTRPATIRYLDHSATVASGSGEISEWRRVRVVLTSPYKAVQGLLGTEKHDKATKTTTESAPPSPNYNTTPTGGH